MLGDRERKSKKRLMFFQTGSHFNVNQNEGGKMKKKPVFMRVFKTILRINVNNTFVSSEVNATCRYS